jgi:hypothetical protein
MIVVLTLVQISEALATGKDCFLDDESWRHIQVINNSSPLIPKNGALYHEGLNYFARVPGLTWKARASDYQHDLKELLALQSAAAQLRSDMMAWYIRAGVASKRSLRSLTQHEADEWTAPTTEYHYDDPITASFTVNYCSYLILINNVLDKLADVYSYGVENKALATEITLSASYCSKTGFCGVQAIILALPIALTALSPEESASVRKWIESFDESKKPIKLWSTILEER